MERSDPAYAGQAGYGPWLLAIYDPWVLGFMARLVWQCPIPPVVLRYRQHVGIDTSMLDPAPGTFSKKRDYSKGGDHPARPESQRARSCFPSASTDEPDHRRG